jgi:hypothetical protein
VVRPKVFGYIRSSRFDLVKVARLTRELEEYAEREDLALAYVFTDNGVSRALFKTPCNGKEEQPSSGVICITVGVVRAAVVGVEDPP